MIIKGQDDNCVISLPEDKGFAIRVLDPLYTDFYEIRLYMEEYPKGVQLGCYSNDIQAKQVIRDLYSYISNQNNYFMPSEIDGEIVF